ncbi:hypothetical protein GOC54_29600 [Sinorhizobium meliloti]|nr:hypothetical protein [Sinorhizobium meliloti]
MGRGYVIDVLNIWLVFWYINQNIFIYFQNGDFALLQPFRRQDYVIAIPIKCIAGDRIAWAGTRTRHHRTVMWCGKMRPPKRLTATGAEFVPTSSQEFGGFIKQETAKFAEIIKSAAITAE